MPYYTPEHYFEEPPFVATGTDQYRVDEQRRRRRMVYGGWGADAKQRMLTRIGTNKSDAWGLPNLTSNIFFTSVSAQAVLYSEPPKISNLIDPSAAIDMVEITRRAGLWPLMQRYQRDTLAFREMLMRVDISRVARTGDPLRDLLVRYRPVFPDLCELVPDPEDPQRPIEVVEHRQRICNGELRWTKERWSLASGVPIHQVSDGSMDISHQFGLAAGGAVGEDYPTRYRKSDGTPVLPYVLHHAALTGCLLDPWCWVELVEATLEIAVDWTFFGHVLKNAAFGKIVAIGCTPKAVQEVNGRTTADSDPTIVHEFEVEQGFSGQASVQMLSQSVSSMEVAESVMLEERKMAVFAGIDESDFQRMSGDPRSAYAIALSQEGKKKAALRYGPVMAMGDQEVLALTAILINREMGGEVFPEDGWVVEYAHLAPIGSSVPTITSGTDPVVVEPEPEQAAVSPAPEGIEAPAVAPDTALQDTALNGAQVDALVEIVKSVARGELPRDAAISIIARSFAVPAEQAADLLGSAGSGFTIRTEPPKPEPEPETTEPEPE